MSWRVQADRRPATRIRHAVRELAENGEGHAASAHCPPASAKRNAMPPRGFKLVKSLGPEGDKWRRKLVLWVDDRPDNNIIEHHSMAAYNIDFVL
jgi:hypothetical protein